MSIKKYISKISIIAVVSLMILPSHSFAATAQKFEISGWIPYWRAATGTADVLSHLSDITEVNPFVFTIKSDGTLLDNGPLSTSTWQTFMAAAKSAKVRVIPTIMTGDGDLLHTLIDTKKHRDAFASTIVQMVKDGGYDGVDIDFEGKHAEDKDNFSKFLQNLYQRMGNKWVMCTIEARTPTADRYYDTDIPKDAEVYANDYKAINKYCDRVRIMAYDQQGIDLALSARAASSSQLYAPVGDPAWVEKVVELTARDVKRSKIMIGVPTYGYEYAVTAYANNQYLYDILWTFNPRYATDLATQYGITPIRNSAGELHFTYVPRDDATSTPPVSFNPSANTALSAAVAASTFATQYNSHLGFRLVDWPDAQSLQQKIDLAKRLGVRGVSIFKFDGGEDQGIWNVIRQARN